MKRIDELLVEMGLENPRVENIAEPFLWLALESHNPKRLEEVMLFARELDSRRSEAEKISIDAAVISAITTLPDNLIIGGKFTTDSITDRLNENRKEREWFSTKEVGRLTGRFGFEESRVGAAGLRGTRWDQSIIETWANAVRHHSTLEGLDNQVANVTTHPLSVILSVLSVERTKGRTLPPELRV